MDNPVLVEVTRGARVESVHRGAIAISDAQGNVLFALGDIERPIYPRSALKPIQALALVESGAADAFQLRETEIALACASHSGEPMHTSGVAAWLARVGLREKDLACGPQAVRYEPVWEDMVRRGEKPTRIHNNCSGKHTGFLTVARHWGIATAGYEKIDHPVQQAVAKALAELSGAAEPLPWGIDGCGAPNFAVPLLGFAHALARLASPHALAPDRARAARQIVEAMMARPELVAGTGRVCTTLMRAGHGRVAVKTGAEAAYAAIVPGHGLGIALKIDDGGGRAAETTIAFLLARMGLIDHDAAAEIVNPAVLNTRNERTGERRPAAALLDAPLPDLSARSAAQ
ncbi:MAG TPA: asparaginase [Rhizomicrobium sp.]|nr:asparaginase [Rhizomicrobium sp.]